MPCSTFLGGGVQDTLSILWYGSRYHDGWELKTQSNTTTSQPPPRAYLRLFRRKKKSQNKNFDDHVRTIFTLMPKLTATMVMFVSLDEFWATS